MKVLVVDDEDLIRSVLGSFLEAMGHEVLLAANGAEALFRVKEMMPEVVFLDIRMPHMDGIEALRLIKEISPSSIAIVMSGIATTAMARDLLQHGAFDYINKPVNLQHLQHLMAVIQTHVAQIA